MKANAYRFASESFHKDPSSDPQNPLQKPGSAAAEQGVEHALAVAQILRQNVVQGSADGQDPHRYSGFASSTGESCVILTCD